MILNEIKILKDFMIYKLILDDKFDFWIKVWKFLYILLVIKLNIIVKY